MLDPTTTEAWTVGTVDDVELLILRHGETEWTVSGRHTGRTEIDLTDQGRTEALAQAPVLASMLDCSDPLVFVSPRVRTRRTVELALPDHGFTVEPLLAEFDYGDYEGLTHDEIDTITPGWDIWRDGCPAGETPADVAQRADRFLATVTEVGSADRDRPVLAVTHGHMSRALAVRALGRPITTAGLFDSATASLSMIRTVRSHNVLTLWNRTPDPGVS